MVAKADADRTHPGPALHELLAKYAPAVILIDEWWPTRAPLLVAMIWLAAL
ncbi:hypothetical protein BZL29_7687, partial [Mycobacterium kansasii]